MVVRQDGVIALQVNGNSGSTNQDSSYGINDENGNRIALRGDVGGQGMSSADWLLWGDIYCSDLTLSTGVYLHTRGYRIFCSGTLTIASGAYVQNNGSGYTGITLAGADGGIGGTLSAGADGQSGGTGGAGVGTGASDGGHGGGAGGSGGIVFISARYISNSGTIRADGGGGSNGEGVEF